MMLILPYLQRKENKWILNFFCRNTKDIHVQKWLRHPKTQEKLIKSRESEASIFMNILIFDGLFWKESWILFWNEGYHFVIFLFNDHWNPSNSRHDSLFAWCSMEWCKHSCEISVDFMSDSVFSLVFSSNQFKPYEYIS